MRDATCRVVVAIFSTIKSHGIPVPPGRDPVPCVIRVMPAPTRLTFRDCFIRSRQSTRLTLVRTVSVTLQRHSPILPFLRCSVSRFLSVLSSVFWTRPAKTFPKKYILNLDTGTRHRLSTRKRKIYRKVNFWSILSFDLFRPDW